MRVPVTVVDDLEVVQVEEQHRHLAAAAREGVPKPVYEQHAVGEAGERVVERLVLELLLELPQLPHGLLEAVVLERRPGLVGECLEQLQVVAAEAARHPEPVRVDHGPYHSRLAAQRRHHRIARATLLEVRLELRREGPLQSDRGVSVADQRPQPVRNLIRDGAHQVGIALAGGRSQRGPAVFAREEDDLGQLAAEGLQGELEQVAQRVAHVLTARERAQRYQQGAGSCSHSVSSCLSQRPRWNSRRTRVLAMTARIKNSPWKNSCNCGLTPAKKSTLRSSVRIKAPARAPAALPRPPKRLMPPSTTAAIEVSVSGVPEVASPEVVTAAQ